MNDVFRHLHVAPELACEFLAVFSCVEYALKETGHVQNNNGDARAKLGLLSVRTVRNKPVSLEEILEEE